jgi:uncharacterized integral membrane protein
VLCSVVKEQEWARFLFVGRGWCGEALLVVMLRLLLFNLLFLFIFINYHTITFFSFFFFFSNSRLIIILLSITGDFEFEPTLAYYNVPPK